MSNGWDPDEDRRSVCPDLLNQYLNRINLSCPRTQSSDAIEAQTRSLESSTLPLSHCAPENQDGKISIKWIFLIEMHVPFWL